MYIINVEPPSDITPRMYSVDFESPHGELGTTAIVLADAPVVGCQNFDAALANIGKLRTIEPNPVLLESVKELL
jgi:hypothetical protein